MAVWVAVILAVFFLAGGIVSLRRGLKTEKRLCKIAGIALIFACAMCVLYLAATYLVLGSIK